MFGNATDSDAQPATLVQAILATARPACFHPRVQRIIVITGTDTGVGKTVLTAWLAAHLHARGARVAALKPLCSGGRDDARALHRALGGTLTLDDINPWYFRAPLAPLLAARKERRKVQLLEVITHIRAIARQFDTVLVEGAGGLLSPLGEGFSTRELIAALRAEVIIVGRNQLGVANHLRLTLEALPPGASERARIALMSLPRATLASRTNPELVREFIHPVPLVILPWCNGTKADARVHRTLHSLVG
jgi:dethiobiotin synthetase